MKCHRTEHGFSIYHGWTSRAEDIFERGFAPPEEFLNGAKDILIIVNDATRPTPSYRIITAILPFLLNKKVKFLVATGMHRAPLRTSTTTSSETCTRDSG